MPLRAILRVAASLLVATSLVATAAAQPSAEAVEKADRAYTLLGDGKHAEAVELFDEALALYESPVIRFYKAQALERQGKLIACRAEVQRIVDTQLPTDAKESWRDVQRKAQQLADELRERIPRIVVRVVGDGAEHASITIDGQPAGSGPQQVDPGSHLVEASSPDGRSSSQRVSLSEGQTDSVELALGGGGDAGLERWAAPAVAYGVGGVGLIIGIVTGSMFISNHGELADVCDEDLACPPEQQDLIDETTTLGNIATAGWAIALAGAAVGTTLLLLGTDGDDNDTEARLQVGGHGVRLQLLF